jgi:hypothetical protein
MATDKTFKVAGISKLNGNYKVRFANDLMRIKVLAKSGHEDIRLMELSREMTKYEAAQALLAGNEFSDVIAQATITEYLDEKAPKATAKAAPAKAPAKAQPKAKAPKAVAKVTEDEDAPF